MIHLIPPLIMFVFTVGLCTLLWLPVRLWRPASGPVRVYWTGVWAALVAIGSVSGAMNMFLLLGMDVVAPVELLLNLLLGGLVAFVVVGWFHLVGAGLVRGVFGAVRRLRASS